jgi:hypothetical protein
MLSKPIFDFTWPIFFPKPCLHCGEYKIKEFLYYVKIGDKIYFICRRCCISEKIAREFLTKYLEENEDLRVALP